MSLLLLAQVCRQRVYCHIVDLHINVFFLLQKATNKATAVSQVLEAFLSLKPKLRITTKFNKQHLWPTSALLPRAKFELCLVLYYPVPNLSLAFFVLKCF